MKKLPLIFFFLSLPATAQVQLDFETSDLTGWESFPASRWEISYNEPVAGIGSLHHAFDNPETGTDGLSFFMGHLMPDSSNVTWRFRIRHGYPPSSQNNWGIFLTADQGAEKMVTGQGISGFVLGVNINGSDDLLKLCYAENNTLTVILVTSMNWQDEIGTLAAPAIEVKYRSPGYWEIKADSAGSFSSQETIGTGYYRMAPVWNYFGLVYRYSSSQDRKLWMDELSISGYFETDTLVPYPERIEVCDERSIRLVFSERMDNVPATQPGNYLLNGSCIPDSVVSSGGNDYLLYFRDPFIQDHTNTLIVSDVTDLSGNRIGSAGVEFVFHRPMFQDVVINEIMADPEPAVLLPQYEYIELLNRSSFALNLGDWSLTAGNDRIILPICQVNPGQYLLLATESAARQPVYSDHCVGIKSFPQLNNEGEAVYLCAPDGRLISYVFYTPDWFAEDYKKAGGWSLERIDPDNPCDACMNWCGSKDYRGGTPCQENSVLEDNPDTRQPVAISVEVHTHSLLELHFSEPLDTVQAGRTENYSLDHDLGNPQIALPVFPEYNRVLLKLAIPLTQFTEYFLSFSSELTDCAGNSQGKEKGIRVAIPESTLPGEIVINEILFNPYPDEYDYLEIVNRSEKVFDLSRIYLAGAEEQNGEISEFCPVSSGGLIFPGEYYLFTECPEMIMNRYFTHNSDAFIVPACLPSMPDKEGYVMLLNRELMVIDEMHYSEDMHFPLIKNPEGISLERVHFDRPATDLTNWHSASETAGFGTPGTVNSQFSESPGSCGEIHIEPEIFSPDNDGFRDLLHIGYQMDHPGYVANIFIFDSRGREVKRLARNQLLGEEGVISWDGMMENGAPAPEGLYLFLTEVFDLTGRVRKYKNTCVLARRK